MTARSILSYLASMCLTIAIVFISVRWFHISFETTIEYLGVAGFMLCIFKMIEEI